MSQITGPSQGKPRPLLLLGSRIFAEEVADLASEIPGFRVAGFVENLEPERCRRALHGLPVHWVDELSRLADDHVAVCALGTTQRSRFIDQASAHGVRFATLVHPRARVSSTSAVGEGSIVSAGVIVAAHTHIGRHVILNRGALVGHHTEIGDYVTVGPGANIAGKCRIGTGTYVAIGAVVIDRISIGSHSVIGAGAVVNKDVPDHVQVVGVPARIVKENVTGR